MLAGTMRHLIRIESPSEVSDGAGGSAGGWTVVAETRASILPVSGRERLQAQAIGADISHTVSIRFRPGVTVKCRIVYGVRVFRILTPLDVEERHRELRLSCVEVFGEAP